MKFHLKFAIILNCSTLLSVVFPVGTSLRMESLAIGWLLASQTVDRAYYQVFMSGNGQYAYASPYLVGPLIRSCNNGQNYSDTTLSRKNFWVAVSLSYSGQYVIAGAFPGPVEISADFGKSWTPTNLPTDPNWGTSVMSDSGQYIVVSGQDYGTAISTDYGVNWDITLGIGGEVTISPDGQSIMGRAATSGTDMFVYYTPDFGKTWFNTTEKILGTQCGSMWYGWDHYPTDEVMGRTLYVAPLEISDDGHLNWTARSFAADNDNEYLFCDYTGKYVFFRTHYTGVSYSTDYGYTWQRSEGNYDYDVFMMSIDKNASRIVTASYSSLEMYYGNITPWYNPNIPTILPSSQPTAQPTQPTSQPTGVPSLQPSSQPSSSPSSSPTSQPTCGGGSSGEANNTICTLCPPGTYSPPFQTHCTACPVGTYSPSYGASECTSCEYPLITQSDGQSSCKAVNLNIGVLPTSVVLITGLLVVCVCISSGQKMWIQIALNFMYPTMDVFSDIAYLLTNDFYSIQIFVACILFIVFPIPWFINTLVQRRAIPHLWISINRVLWLRADREGDYIYYAVFPCFENGRFPLLSVVKHTSLRTVASELIVWIIAITIQILCIALWLFVLPLNCLFLFGWLLLGIFFYLTKCIAIGPVWNIWFYVWTCGSEHSTDVIIDTEEFNICLQHEFYFETLPQFCLQLINNMYLGKLSSVAIFSFVWSLYTALNGLWKFVYYRYCLEERKEMKDIPIDKSLRIRLKWFNIDWVLVDAKLTPQSKDKPCRSGGRITRSTEMNNPIICGDDGFFDVTIGEALLVDEGDKTGFGSTSNSSSSRGRNKKGSNNSDKSSRTVRSQKTSRNSRRGEYTALPSDSSFYSQAEPSAPIDFNNSSSGHYAYSPVYTTAAVMVPDNSGSSSMEQTVYTVEPELPFDQWLLKKLQELGVSEFHATQCYNIFKHECITSVAVWSALPETVFDREYLSTVGITQVGLQQHLLRLHSVIRKEASSAV